MMMARHGDDCMTTIPAGPLALGGCYKTLTPLFAWRMIPTMTRLETPTPPRRRLARLFAVALLLLVAIAVAAAAGDPSPEP